MKPLTEKQQKMLDFLKERIRTGVPPTVREICKAADIKSTSTAHAYLQKLEDAGYISREGGLTRSIRMRRVHSMARARRASAKISSMRAC